MSLTRTLKESIRMIKKQKKVAESAGPRTNLKAVQRLMKGLTKSDKFINLQNGENIIRILPSELDNGSFYFEKVQHFGFADSEGNRAYPCLIALGQDYCPVCHAIDMNEAEDDDDVQEALDSLKPRTQYMCNAIDRSEGKPVVKILNLSVGVLKDLAGFLSDPDYGDITDPDEGFDIKIEKVPGKRPIDTRYKVRARPKASPIGMDDWAEHLYDLEKEAYREIPTVKEYIELLDENFGDVGMEIPEYKLAKSKKKARKVEEDNEEEDEEEEEESPRRKAVRNKKKNKRVIEEEDEEELDEDDEDSEENEPAPKSRRVLSSRKNAVKKKVSKKIEEDDEEGEEDIEDDLDEEDDD